jgi:hypothetical protein
MLLGKKNTGCHLLSFSAHLVASLNNLALFIVIHQLSRASLNVKMSLFFTPLLKLITDAF